MRHYWKSCDNHFRSLRGYNRSHRAKSAHAFLLSTSAMQIIPCYFLIDNVGEIIKRKKKIIIEKENYESKIFKSCVGKDNNFRKICYVVLRYYFTQNTITFYFNFKTNFCNCIFLKTTVVQTFYFI